MLVYRNPSLCLYNVNWRALLPHLPPDYNLYRHSRLPGTSASTSSSSAAAGVLGLPVPLASPFEAPASGLNANDEAPEAQTQWVEVAHNADRELCARIDLCDSSCTRPPAFLTAANRQSPAPQSNSASRLSCWSSAVCQRCALYDFSDMCCLSTSIVHIYHCVTFNT